MKQTYNRVFQSTLLLLLCASIFSESSDNRILGDDAHYMPKARPKRISYPDQDIEPSSFDKNHKTLEQQMRSSTKYLMSEWEEHMKDFDPSDIITFEVKSREIEVLTEYVDALPSKLIGVYFVASHEDQRIDLTIQNPQKKPAFNRLMKKDGFFYFDADQIGEYQFIFGNRKWDEPKVITFALHGGNSSEDWRRYNDTANGKEYLDALLQLNDLQAETRFAFMRQENHYISNF